MQKTQIIQKYQIPNNTEIPNSKYCLRQVGGITMSDVGFWNLEFAFWNLVLWNLPIGICSIGICHFIGISINNNLASLSAVISSFSVSSIPNPSLLFSFWPLMVTSPSITKA